MSVHVPKAFVEQYSANVMIELQQKGSKLRGLVTPDDLQGEFGFYDEVGKVQANKHTTRHGDTVLSNTPHNRRRIGSETWDYADLVDREDKLKTLYDPTNPYVNAAVMALGRSIDECILDAAFGTAYTGQKGEVAVAFPDTQKILVDADGATAKGLTLEKLILAKSLFGKADLDEQEEAEITFVYTQNQLDDLLRTTEVKNADYAAVKALVKGTIDTFMGFNFVKTNLTPKESTTRKCCAFVKSGITLVMPDDIHASVDKRPDKRNSQQVFAALTCGAGRMNEKKVVEVDCLEA